jgi:zinc protease
MTIKRIARVFIASLVLVLGPLQPAEAELPAATDHKRPGGIAFRHVTLPQLPRHAIAFAWRDRFAASQPGKSGIAILGPQLLIGGDTPSARGEFIERMRDLQSDGQFNGSPLLTQGLLLAPPSKFAEAASTLGALLSPRDLSPERLADLQRRAIEEARQAGEQAAKLPGRLMTRLTLGAGPVLDTFNQPADGLSDVTLSDIENWRAAVLGRDRVLVTSAGPLLPDAVAREIDRIFSGLPDSHSQMQWLEPSMRALGKTVVLERDVAQTLLIVGGPTGWAGDAESLVAAVAIQSMNGFDARFMRTLRGKLGATYNVRAYPVRFGRDTFAFYIETAVEHAKSQEALEALVAEYQKIITEGLTQEELEAAKIRTLADANEQFSRPATAAVRLRTGMLAGFPADHYATLEARLRALDLATLNEGLGTKFPKTPLTVVIIAPKGHGLRADCVIQSPDEVAKCE